MVARDDVSTQISILVVQYNKEAMSELEYEDNSSNKARNGNI